MPERSERNHPLVVFACGLWLAGLLLPADAESAQPTDRDRLSWSFSLDGVFNGTLHVRDATGELAAYEVDCSFEVEPEAEAEEDPESPSLRALELPGYPNPVLVGECTVGAHSRMVVVFDPVADPVDPVLVRIGSFVAHAEPTAHGLSVSYDQRCDDCEDGFETVTDYWPATADDPVARVRALYDGPASGIFFLDEPETMRQVLSPTLVDLLLADRRGRPMGNLDFDPVVNGQDAQLRDLEFSPAVIERDAARVTVTFRNFDQPNTLVYSLLRESSGWRVDDVTATEGAAVWLLSDILRGK